MSIAPTHGSGHKRCNKATRIRRISDEGDHMYAIIEAGGKQARVQVGDTLYTERLHVDAEGYYEFDKVLLIGEDGNVTMGAPYVNGAKVKVKIVKHGKQKKIVVFKMKAKKNYRRKQGHRQQYTKCEIVEITK